MRSLDVVAADGVVVDPEVLSRLMRAGSSLELTDRGDPEPAQGDAHAAAGRRAGRRHRTADTSRHTLSM
ncbi:MULTISPECIES: hypothetical protein [unclassified Actinomyces]|uniref:hypothetical protein n=1 Tax=unclassified Actinomyces TaxID=2609248 RepID=UPI001EF3BB64|nr:MULTISPECIES: hypothetical protein [unclassified Actinomyces]